jgi:hypothetical protein
MAKLDGTGMSQAGVSVKQGATALEGAKPENPPSPCDGSRGGLGPTEEKGNHTTPLGKG